MLCPERGILKIDTYSNGTFLILYDLICEPKEIEGSKIELLYMHTNRYYLFEERQIIIPIYFDFDRKYAFATFVASHYLWKIELK
jgi:hypothetical protein